MTNFWRYFKFWFALKQRNDSLAKQILKALENSAEVFGILRIFGVLLSFGLL